MNFNFSKAVSASMKVNDFVSKDSFLAYLHSISHFQTVVSKDKVVFFFDDESLLCLDGGDIKARPVGACVEDFLEPH